MCTAFACKGLLSPLKDLCGKMLRFFAGAQTVKFNDLEWSLWDRWILEGDLTVQQVLDWFKVSTLPPINGQ